MKRVLNMVSDFLRVFSLIGVWVALSVFTVIVAAPFAHL